MGINYVSKSQYGLTLDLGPFLGGRSQQEVSLRVFDLSGRLVKDLIVGESRTPGRHEVVRNGRDDAGRQVASGAYFYRRVAGDFAETKRMVLIK
jgi:flagellar hook assembly protein FlgD